MRFSISCASDWRDAPPPCKNAVLTSSKKIVHGSSEFIANEYSIDINSIDDLKAIQEEAGRELIIDFECGTILIYDDYIE